MRGGNSMYLNFLKSEYNKSDLTLIKHNDSYQVKDKTMIIANIPTIDHAASWLYGFRVGYRCENKQ